MKNTYLKPILVSLFLVFVVACSTKRNNFISRNTHALSTEYNILYNGGIALDKGIAELKLKYNDNYWKILPVERMQVSQDQILPGQTKNANFDRAEEKAKKAILKHSMNIEGGEKNPQMDEAHLMLGKARYYDQRFVPALEAFNYVLYKYPNSDKIYEVKIWREKTNMRLDNDALAVKNLNKLLKEIKFKDQIFADANATLAQAFLNLQQKDSAISKLKIAAKFTKENEEKARYNYILGQIYEDLNFKDSAFLSYQKIIDMNRKASRQYVIRAHAQQAQQFNFIKGDTVAFLKKFKALLNDRENRPFLDVLNHQMGLFYDKNKKFELAKKYYNISLRKNSTDDYLAATNYKNLAAIYFNKAQYVFAGKYYDSTLTKLDKRSREFKLFTKKRDNLDDVIKYEIIATRNDSLLNTTSLSLKDQQVFYQKYIDALKKAEEKAAKEKLLAEKIAAQAEASNEIQEKVKSNLIQNETIAAVSRAEVTPTRRVTSGPSGSSDFYFYNQSTVAYGKLEFKKLWGNRAYAENWRLNSSKETSKEDPTSKENDIVDTSKKIEEKYTTDFYINKLPKGQTALDSIAKERNFAYFQLGTIYKEKFKEYQLAANKLEKLLDQNPEERLILPSMYNLFKIYEIINPAKALVMKDKIVAKYPDSRYAQIVTNPTESLKINSKPEVAYDSLYADYSKGLIRETLPNLENAIEQFAGDEMLPKFELLKANLNGKLKGLTEFKKGLNYVSLTYPNSFEGKETEKFISQKMPQLEALSFQKETKGSWKILYELNFPEENSAKILIDKITKFAKERTIEKLNTSIDVFLIDKNFLVIHGIKNEENAKGIASILKEYKEYKITETAIVISSENYKVLQIKKNLAEFSSGNWVVNVLKQPIAVPQKTEKINEKNSSKGTVMPPESDVEPRNTIPPAIQKLMDEERLKNKTKNQPVIDPMQTDDIAPKK